MPRDTRSVSILAIVLLMAALFAAPGVSAAAPSAGTAAMHGSGWGAMSWSADHVVWLRSRGSLYAVRGHASWGWDDCMGPVDLRLTVSFQRQVGDKWVTTQTRNDRHQYASWGNHEMSFSPTFNTRSGDTSHATRLVFTYQWYDGKTLHATRTVVRIPR